MTETFLGLRIATCLFWLSAAAAATAPSVELEPNPDALARAMQGHCIVQNGR